MPERINLSCPPPSICANNLILGLLLTNKQPIPFGPYSLWHHKHFIKEVDGGVEMIDIIDYKIPLGLLGRIMNPILVQPKLEEIFKFRKEKLEELFGILKND